MENKDIFEQSVKNKFTEEATLSNNFFINNERSQKMLISTSRHLNGYDSTLLEEDAYRNVADDLLKLEYKIGKIEKNIGIIDKKLEITKNINDSIEINNLQEEKNKLLKDYEYYSGLYKEKSLSSKISINLTSMLKRKKKPVLSKIKNTVINFLKKLLPCKIHDLIEMRNSIDTLNSINSTVDEIITQKDFSSDRFNKYNQLSQYLIKSNELQNKILKNIKVK